jgi:hypothetical protein
MGDIKGRPKAPEPQIVYVPQYNSAPQASAPTQNAQTPQEPALETPEQKREKSLLGRSRSRLGTILTGFRGILAPAETQGERKTLLGE